MWVQILLPLSRDRRNFVNKRMATGTEVVCLTFHGPEIEDAGDVIDVVDVFGAGATAADDCRLDLDKIPSQFPEDVLLELEEDKGGHVLSPDDFLELCARVEFFGGVNGEGTLPV